MRPFVTLTACVTLGLAAPTFAANFNIMTIGDSLTHGYIEGPDNTLNQSQAAYYGWRVPLYDVLTTQGHNVQMLGSQYRTSRTNNGSNYVNDGTSAANMHHEGHSSWRIGGTYTSASDASIPGNTTVHSDNGTTKTWSFNTPSTIPNNFNGNNGVTENVSNFFNPSAGGLDLSNPNETPNVIMLWVGINDVKNDEDPASAPDRLSNLINLIVGTTGLENVQLFVSNLARVGNEYSQSSVRNQRVDDFNLAFQSSYFGSFQNGVASHNTHSNVSLIDVHSFIDGMYDEYLAGNATNPFYDGLHLTSAAYGELGEFYAQYVPEPATLVLLALGAAFAVGRRRGAA